MSSTPCVIGAGPAGLAAALEWTRLAPQSPALLVDADRQVGGLSKTVERNGYRFDIGGHRFFTKNRDVEALWRAMLPNDFLRRPRLSRIHYRGKYFDYPLKPLNALLGLGFFKSLWVGASFLKRKIVPLRPETSFADWVTNRFGDKLYSIFFKTYTEKVWGIPCQELSADWAAQRIRNLNLFRAVLDAFRLGRKRDVASLIDEFDYPRLGPGQMYEAMAAQAVRQGTQLRLEHEVVRVQHAGGRITGLSLRHGDTLTEQAVDLLISTMPITELVLRLHPTPPDEVLQAAKALRYRSILTVNLVLASRALRPETWVYLHDPDIHAGRLQFFMNWSPYMVPDGNTSTVGLEYFAFEGDEFWSTRDADLVKQAIADLGRVRSMGGLAVTDGFVVRYPKAYPMYESGYQERIQRLRDYLAGFSNLACAGRYGQFRYNNMDHSILTGQLAARRLLGQPVDPFAVNEDAQYLEEAS